MLDFAIQSMKHIFLLGFMGSGKSSLAIQLSEKLNFPYVDSDSYIEEKCEMSISELFSQKGEAYFRTQELEFLKDFSAEQTTIIATGGGMPCDDERISLIKEKGVSFYLYLPKGKLTERLMDDKAQRPLISELDTQEAIDDLVNKLLLEREKYYFQANYICKAEMPTEELMTDIIEKFALH